MATDRNLSPNPALGTNATGWSLPSGYARATGLGHGLPRATGITGTPDADILCPAAVVTAGQQYVHSISIYAAEDHWCDLIVSYYNGTSYVDSSGSSVRVENGPGETKRFVIGPYRVPAGANRARLKLIGIGGMVVEVTGHRVAPYSGDKTLDGLYFDGDTPGAGWDGTAQNSTSTWIQFLEQAAAADGFSYSESPSGPVGADLAAATDLFGIAAAGSVDDTAQGLDGFLIAELGYDPLRGRVRIDAFTFPPLVVKAQVSRRLIGGRWVPVRGGTVDVIAGYMARRVDDYEFPAGLPVEYRIQGLDDAGQPVQQAIVRRDPDHDRAWIKFVAKPTLNLPITIIDWGEISRPSRSSHYDVLGQRAPVVVSDVHSSRQVTVKLVAHTKADAEALDTVLGAGQTAFLQVRDDLELPSMYVSIGDYSWKRPAPRSRRSIFTVPLVEVAAPPPSIFAPPTTWQNVLTGYLTWQDVLDGVPTWRELAD